MRFLRRVPLPHEELFQTSRISNTALIWKIDPRSVAMATQIVMDHNGDTRHNFDAKEAKALLKAERRFKALTGAGFTAAIRTADKEPVVTRTRLTRPQKRRCFFRGWSAAKIRFV